MGVKWTRAELREFDRLTLASGSTDHMTRKNGRRAIERFVDLHGKEKTDAMFNHLMKVTARRAALRAKLRQERKERK
jgi:hypothetical protein